MPTGRVYQLDDDGDDPMGDTNSTPLAFMVLALVDRR